MKTETKFFFFGLEFDIYKLQIYMMNDVYF